MNTLRNFLFERVYDATAMEAESSRGRDTIRSLYRHFTRNPEQLPQELSDDGISIERAGVDYIAGMTDLYALRIAEEVLL